MKTENPRSGHAKRLIKILDKIRELAGEDRTLFRTKWEVADALRLKSKSRRKTFGRDFNDLLALGLIADVNTPSGKCPSCGTNLRTERYYCLPEFKPLPKADFGEHTLAALKEYVRNKDNVKSS